MQRQSPSIFNDIVGPVMIGPSSSHTCGPSRIGYLCRQLLHEKLKSAVVEFAREGAYTQMYKGQRSDMGYVNGLLGFRPEDPRLRKSFELAKEQGIDITFDISDFEPTVPNLSRVTLYGEKGEKHVVYTDSTGGGTVNLLTIDGYQVSIVGDCYELLVRLNTSDTKDVEASRQQIESLIPANEGLFLSTQGSSALVNLKSRKALDSSMTDQVTALPHVEDVTVLEPILVVNSNRNTDLPFHSAQDLLSMCQDRQMELWEAGVEYEMARSGWNRQEVLDYMAYVIETMERGVEEALEGQIDMNGILKPSAGRIQSYLKTNPRALDMGLLNTAVPWSMATMEYSSAMGLVLCAPTGGSAGVFPGAVLGTAAAMELPMEEKVRLMFATSAIGIAMSKDCNYSAELYGCQVEPGAASAMAAGALAYLMGGTPEQSMDAASCAIQNILGTICDPVAGLVQVPCISRNAMSAANAMVSANIVMGGYTPLIPLDEAAETMFRVGKQLPGELRCTCKGGLCTTPAGKRLAGEQEARDNQR